MSKNKNPKKPKTKRAKGLWLLEGYDAFSNEDYSLGSYKTEQSARRAAKRRLRELEISQPTATSGGQGFCGIQDRVYIMRPDGSVYRFTG